MAVEGVPRRRPPEPKKLTRAERWKRRGPLLPALIFAIILTQVPFVFTLFYSFQQWNLLRPGTRQWVGLDNYGKVFTDDLFRNAVVNTVALTVSTVLLSLVIGLAFALTWTKLLRPKCRPHAAHHAVPGDADGSHRCGRRRCTTPSSG